MSEFEFDSYKTNNDVLSTTYIDKNSRDTLVVITSILDLKKIYDRVCGKPEFEIFSKSTVGKLIITNRLIANKHYSYKLDDMGNSSSQQTYTITECS